MKVKKVIIASVVILLVGIVFGVAGMSLLGWNFKKLDTNEYIEKTYEVSDEQTITSVRVSTSFPLRVKSGETFAMTYYETDDSVPEIACNEGEFTFTESHRNDWWKFFRFYTKTVELTVPSGTAVIISTANAELTLENMQLQNVQVNAANTYIAMVNCTGTTFTVDSANLDLRLTACTFDSLVVNATNVKTTLNGSTFARVAFDSANLTLHADLFTAPRLGIHAVNATVKATLVGAQSEYNITTDKINGTPPASQTGSDPQKHIAIDVVNWSGSLLFSE